MLPGFPLKAQQATSPGTHCQTDHPSVQGVRTIQHCACTYTPCERWVLLLHCGIPNLQSCAILSQTHSSSAFDVPHHTANKPLLDVLGASGANPKFLPPWSSRGAQSQAPSAVPPGFLCNLAPGFPLKAQEATSPATLLQLLAHGDAPLNHSPTQSKVLANARPFQQAA